MRNTSTVSPQEVNSQIVAEKCNCSKCISDKEIRKQLSENFSEKDLEWRVSRVVETGEKVKAIVVPFIDARAIQDRLDEVLGIGGWYVSYEKSPIGEGMICKLSLKIGGEWITKEDGADISDTTDSPVKAVCSNALKRAAVQWGIGRYLYNLGTCWGNISEHGRYYGKDQSGNGFRWDPPNLASEERISVSDSLMYLSTDADGVKSNETPSGLGVVADGETSSIDWKSVEVHFGKNLEGKKLGEITPYQLNWLRNEWKPKPYQGKISAKDQNLRDVLDTSMGIKLKAKVEEDEIPF